MIFVDSNVFIYAVGRPHPLRSEAQNFFLNARRRSHTLVTSAEVLQELLHVYLPVGRMQTLDAALELATRGIDEIYPVDADTVLHARHLADQIPSLDARDLLHLSLCQLRRIHQIKTFDRNLKSAFG
jgi:predicted nucleic acid-binding protein